MMELSDVRAVVLLQMDELAELTEDGEDWNVGAIFNQTAAVLAACLYVERIATCHADALVEALPETVRAILKRLEKSGVLEGAARVERTANVVRGEAH